MNPFRKLKIALLCLLCLLIYNICGNANAAPPSMTITSGKCTEPDITLIPVSAFTPATQLPLDPYSIAQGYNNTKSEGFKFNGKWFYGHSGLDMVNAEKTPGVNDIKAVNNGYVVASLSATDTHGWGETIVIATRPNAFSDEIITHHYHHMHVNAAGTTRKFNACDNVNVSDIIGKEGKTGFATGAHLHHTIRRWENISRLKKALNKKTGALLGVGYSYGDDRKLARNLDPGGILNNTYRDYTDPTAPYAWSLPFVLDMRHRGIEFGLFNGRYGAGENVTRREAARWLKIAAQRSNTIPVTPTFLDVDSDDPDLPYIEELTHFPSGNPVINVDATLKASGKNRFHPDRDINRAEALKMVILTFYSAEFLQLYNNFIWTATGASASALLQQFDDVSVFDWYAPFVYFGAVKGLVTVQPKFHPGSKVKREEMAKWVSDGTASIEAALTAPCNTIICPSNYFCEPTTAVCKAVPTCIPSETVHCPAGGGYDPTADAGTPPVPVLDSGIDTGITPPPVCTPGDTQTCGNCGVRMCDSAGQWGTNCTGEGVCSTGAIESQTCSITGTQSRTCSAFCAWGGWSTCFVPPPPPVCTDTYISSSTPSCYTTPGGPTLCLAVQQVSSANWRYQVCKSGGSFINNYKTVLGDDNHTALLSDTYTGNPGDTCTPWRNFSVGYIAGYGSANGAGVRAEVLSPASCVLPACTYSTGTVTIRKECL